MTPVKKGACTGVENLKHHSENLKKMEENMVKIRDFEDKGNS